MMQSFLIILFNQIFSRPLMAIFTIGDFMDQFLLQKLKRVKLEFRELLGMLSIKELTTNFQFITHYQDLHQTLIRV